jgi:hypothetical protein
MLQNVVMKDAIMMLTWQMLTAETLLKFRKKNVTLLATILDLYNRWHESVSLGSRSGHWTRK